MCQPPRWSESVHAAARPGAHARRDRVGVRCVVARRRGLRSSTSSAGRAASRRARCRRATAWCLRAILTPGRSRHTNATTRMAVSIGAGLCHSTTCRTRPTVAAFTCTARPHAKSFPSRMAVRAAQRKPRWRVARAWWSGFCAKRWSEATARPGRWRRWTPRGSSASLSSFDASTASKSIGTSSTLSSWGCRRRARASWRARPRSSCASDSCAVPIGYAACATQSEEPRGTHTKGTSCTNVVRKKTNRDAGEGKYVYRALAMHEKSRPIKQAGAHPLRRQER